MHKPILYLICILIFSNLRVQAQLYQGPEAGSIAGGVVVTTDDFSDQVQSTVNFPMTIKGTRNEYIPEQLPSEYNKVMPVIPGTSNFAIDRTGPARGGDSPSILLKNFPGVPRTNFVPPDPSVAAGPTHVMGGVNSTFRIWDKNGNVIKTISASTWLASLGLGIGGTVSDPKIIYDHYSKRWVMSWITPPIGPRAYDVISVSDDSIPLGTWYNFAMRTDLNGNTPVDLWRDYQGMGYDMNAIYITGNGFTLSSSSFVYSTLRIFNKSQLYANTAGPVSWFDMWDIRDPGNQNRNFGIRPSYSTGNPNAFHLLCNSNSTGTYISLYKLVSPLNNPSMTGVVIPVVQYSSPPASGQLGSTATITSGGSSAFRNEPVYRNGYLFAVHAVRFDNSYSAFKYYKIDVSADSAVQDITFGAPEYYYSYPALSVDKNENVMVSYSRSGTSEYIGAAYTTRTSNDPEGYFNPSSWLQPGRGTYVNTGSSNRWGDYMGAWLDPVTEEEFWVMTEFADLQNFWGVWVGNTRISPYSGARIFSDKDTLEFGNIERNASSDTQKVVLRNYGSPQLNISSIQSSSSEFVVTQSPATPFSLSFNDSAILMIAFRPVSPGVKYDSVVISSNDLIAPVYAIGLRGKGYVINPVQAGVIYAVTGAQSNGSLLTVNSQNGVASSVGETGISQLNGLSIRPSDNQMYGVLSSSPATNLYRVNSSEGDAYPVDPIPAPNIRGIAFDLNDDLYCSSIDGKLYKYYIDSRDTDFVGNTGIASLFGLSINPVNGRLWGISSSGGIYKIDKNTGEAISVGNTGNAPNTDIAFSKTGLLYGVSGIGAATCRLLQIDTVTGVSSVIGSNTGFAGINGLAISPEVVGIVSLGGAIPERYSLQQNYPNPFNPATTIIYDLPLSGTVSLNIYDALGREVVTLVNEFQQAGSYRVDFNGSSFSSGVYFYSLSTASFRQVRSMILLK